MIDSFWEVVAVLLAGVAAGGINTIVGSGTLVTFPTLLAVGLPPVLANVSNSVGLVPGSAAGAWGYRAELRGQLRRVLVLSTASLTGAIVGALLLLFLPSEAFEIIVPVLIGLGVVLVIVGPWVQRRVRARVEARGEEMPEHGVWWVWPAIFFAGVYGGYFGAAQGVLLMAILGIGVVDTMQRHNATKNVLSVVVNGIAAIVFVIVIDIDWVAAGIVAAGAFVGGLLGAKVGRRLSPNLLRGVIVVVGVVAIVNLLVG